MVLVDLLSGLAGRIKLKGRTDIDSPVYKLHYGFTSTILFAFCILISATNLIGEPIVCTFNEHPLLKDTMINPYCWIHGTYTQPHFLHKNTRYPPPHPGISAGTGGSKERHYHTYYQWVPYVLFLQALVFYAPHWLWNLWEGGKVASASQELQSPVSSKDSRQDRIQLVADYLHVTLHDHNLYALKFLFCEVINFVIPVVNIWIIDTFLGGKFLSYGPEVFSYVDGEGDSHPSDVLFPKVTKCDFRTVGPSGTVQQMDIMCVLPHSIVNEKVYLFLWVWLWVLIPVSALAVIYRCLVFFVPFLRLHLLTKKARDLNKNDINNLSANLQVGDYFLLYLLHKNVSHLAFKELVKALSFRIAGKINDNLEMGEKVPTGNRGYFIMNEAR